MTTASLFKIGAIALGVKLTLVLGLLAWMAYRRNGTEEMRPPVESG
jgi:hypothetical protein